MGGVVARSILAQTCAVCLGTLLFAACGGAGERPGGPGADGGEPGAGGQGGEGVTSGSGNGAAGLVNAGGSAGEGDASGSGATASGSGGEGNMSGGSGAAGGVDGEGGFGAGGGMVELCPSDTAPGTPPEATACDPTGEWGEGEVIDVDQDGSERLVAVTPDELTITWVRANRSEPEFRVADRATSDEEFGDAEVVVAANVLALSPDGLRLVVLSGDKGSLGELSRASRDGVFGEQEDGAFSVLNEDAADNALIFGTAVIAPDDRGLYYTVFGADDDYPLHYSERSGAEPWPVGEPIESCELKAQGSLVRQPTGVSADGLTLFFFDGVRGEARAAWRATPDAAFSWFVDLGARSRAQPNAACDQLYYTVIEETSSLLVAAAD